MDLEKQEMIELQVKSPANADKMQISIFLSMRELRKQQYLQNKACQQGDHGIYMEFNHFGGGYIHWRCRNCGGMTQQLDEPFTI